MTRKELSQVYFLKKELKLRERQLNELISASQISSPKYDGMPFQNTNENSDKVSDTAIKMLEYMESIRNFKDAIAIRIASIDRWIMSLDDSYLRQLVYYRCIECLSWNKIGMLLGTSDESVRKYYERHIK